MARDRDMIVSSTPISATTRSVRFDTPRGTVATETPGKRGPTTTTIHKGGYSEDITKKVRPTVPQLPAGYLDKLTARREAIEKARAGIRGQKQRMTAQQLRNQSGGVAARLQKQQAAKQFERAKQESLAKLDPEFTKQLELEEGVEKFKIEQERIRTLPESEWGTETTTYKFEPGVETYVTAPGEKLVMEAGKGYEGQVKVTGIKSGYFGTTLSIPEYTKRVEALPEVKIDPSLPNPTPLLRWWNCFHKLFYFL